MRENSQQKENQEYQKFKLSEGYFEITVIYLVKILLGQVINVMNSDEVK
jgi:hypothetical protein